MDESSIEAPVPAVEPAAVPRTRRGVFISLSTAVSVFVLVLASTSFGIYIGHDVFKPHASPSRSASSGSNLPFGNFGNFQPPTSTPAQGPGNTKASAAAAKIAKSVDPGLVDIDTNLSYQGASAAGTGMILTSNGLVLTNNHVIDGATSITARDVATKQVYTATVVGYDATRDVALLKLKDASGLQTVSIGNSNKLSVGEKIVGIGNAGGVGGTPSNAAGKIVALNQSITASDDGGGANAEQLTGTIEINADIQPGDSGGPLVTSKGKVVGMDTAASAGNEVFGFNQTGTATKGFAIPIATAIDLAKSIEAGDATTSVHIGKTAFLGIEVETAAQARDSGTSFGSSGPGAVVAQVLNNTPASQSSLTTGDTITSVNGQAITSPSDLAGIMQTLSPGATATIGYSDANGAQTSTSIRLASGPPQ
jgi:S1-C subfamily serine protease